MIQIKRNNKVFFTLEDFGEGSKLSYQLMDHHYIILKFTTATPIYFEIGDSVEIPDFGYFELTSSYFPKHNDSDGYDYEMQMDAYYMSWKNKLCKYRPQHGANETSFSLTTTVGVHMNVVLGNLKALGLTYNGKDFSVDYTTYNNKAFDVQKRFLIEYGSISILDALNAICSEDALNCEWWIDGSIIYLGYCEMEGQTTFEQNVNVLSMSYSESKSTYITRLYAFGSDRNIPKGYFTGADADVTTDGVATDYLMLPNKEVDSDGFYAKDGYLENVNVVKNDKQAIEGVVMFEEEYPKVESVVSSIKTYDSTVDNEDGTKTTQTFWQVTSTDSFTNSFKESWIKSNLTLGIKFTSGALMGMEFDVSFKVIDKVNYFEIVANDTYGRTLPDGVMCPKVGDKYFLFNWDATKITDTDLIPTAQLSLFDRAKQYYQKTMISNSNFTCTMDGDKFYNDGTYDYHPLGEQVKLINDMFAQVDADGKHYRNSRIIGMEIPLDIPYDHPQYTVGEKAATSRLGKLEDKVDSIKVNGMQIGGIGSGNGGGVYVIGLNDSTPASDSNVYSSRRSRMEFVSRLQDNTAKSTITWEKVQKFFSGLLVGNFNNENGGSWTPDAEGRSHLITDYLEVRMKAIFEELVIKKTSTIGGKEIISPAGGVVAHKVEEVTVTYNNVSQKAYRCYFLAEQEGDAVDNDFAIGDQVRSESFNVRKGTYHKVGNHFYWRLIIGRDEEPVELEGKKYHYIDLSDTDCATASDIPAKGDVLSQCGNRTDVDRQNCLIFSAVDTYSPSVSLYHGINSYSFANKEYVEYGVNKQTNKAFFNVYGDMYVGDRPTKENGYEGSSYIKYDSAAKQVSVKGKISAKSTVDGKELSQYIKDNSAGGLTEEQVNNLIKNSQVIADLQNQVDGAIETWFYDGVPTLKNAPASSWTTDKEKDTHLGDLYYDNKTGKAYRFAKDGNTYKWTIITDTDIAKALSDASKAQETADGKMKVFSSQPTPPYQLGDIWVNATYPTDGSIYKNEILRCQTAKAKGSSFAIADWTKASKYTDDSALNSFKEEYKNDMASYKEQLDEKVETWFYNYAPTTQNKPASDWTTDTLKSQHAGDLFYNTSNGYTYRWTGTAWARIKDNDINTAMTAASKAQDTADGKRTVFTSQPTVPYDEGDLWASGGDDGKTLMVCIKGRTTGSFTSSEWVKANDSDLNAFAKTIEESLNGIRDQLDKKAETWYQPSDPSASWTTDDAKKEHKGDLWYNTSNNQTFFWNGTKWDKQDVPTEVFDKIDGKSSIYVSKPASYEERDLWILEAAYTLGGVAYSKGELVVATKTNASFSAADWTKKVKYTDDTVANAAKKAAEEAKKAAEKAQGDISKLGTTVTDNKKAFDNYVTDGYLEPSEIAAMAQDSKRLEDAFAAAEKSYTEVKGAEVLANTKELTDLKTAFATLTTAKTELVTYLSDISARYNKADTNGKATIVSAVGTKFTNFQGAYSAFYDKLGLANAYITRKIYGDLGVVIGDVTSLAYLKKALMDTPDTEINGGLILTSLIGLRDTGGNTTAGINGITEKSAKGGGIAAWFGGEMVDKDYNDGSKTPANTIFRFDGSGYVAGGAIWWGTDGRVHADPTSFIISEKNLGAYLTFFEPTWKSGSAGTSVADLVSLKPNAPFSKLGVSGDATFEGAITFHGISITYDATNKAIKIDGNLYATGGITAYGAGTSTSGGGGLNGSVKSYADALKLTSESLSEVASAYSIKALDSRISSLEGGSATSIETTGSGNAVTSVSKSGTKITFTKGSTFSLNGHTHTFASLTSKPSSLSGYGITDGVNAISVTGSGNAVTAASVSGHTLTLTKGSTFSLSNHTHYVGTTQVQGSSAEQALTGITKIDNILKLSKATVTVNTSYKAEQNRLVIYGNTYGNDANYIKSARKLSYGDGGPQLVFSTSENPDASGVQSAALVYTDHDTIGAGVSLSFVTNQGDAYFIAPHIKALTAFQGNLAWSYITNKPTTLSGFGITDAYTKSQVDAIAAKYLPLTGGTLTGQLKIVASALNGAYNGLRIGDDCYIGDCNFGNTIGLMGVDNNNAGMVKFGKGGMKFGYNGSNHIASTTAQWTNLNADLLDGWHKDNIVWSGAVNSDTASLSHYWAKLFDITVTDNQYNDRSFTFLFSNGYNDTYSVVVLRIRQNGAKNSGAYNFSISLRELVGNMSSRLRVYYNNATGNVQLWGNCQGQYGSLSYTIIKKTARASADFTSQGTLVTNSSFSAAQSLPATTGDSPYTLLDGATRIGIVKQADQLVTARSLWGQSFNGTANVSGNMTGVGNINTSAAPAGTIYTNNWFRSKGSTGWCSEDHGGGWYMSDNTWIRNFGGKDVFLSNKLSVNGNVGIGTTAPSHKLHVSGEIYTTTKVNINGIILEKDSNGDLKVNGNLYATGGISAYGTSSAGSGGGLNGSVKSYSDALKLTSESLSEIASAYSIKALASRISSLEGGSATSISVSGSGNAVTSVTKNGTTISVVKGSTFSLSGHTHKWADITDRPSSLKNPSALSWSGYSSGSYDGSAAKSISIPNNTNQLTNGAGFITASASITGNAATATKVNHSLSVFGKSFNGSADVTVADTDLIASISTATANLTDKTEILTSYASDNGFNDSNSKNRIYRRPASAIWGYINSKTISNADKLDNVHLNGIFTALSNTNNGVSMTIGTVAKSLANMQVYSATKLVTARNIALNGDFTGNANFDGSANITINGYMSYCNATVSNTNTYPWRRIAKVNELTGNYSDGCILLYISEGFNGGYYGIARVYIRTDNISTGASASCSIQWISRNGYGLDSLKIAMYKTTGKAYYDVFLKMRSAYASVVIRTLQDQRGGLGKRFTLVNSTETTNAASHTEAYATIEDAATAIHNQAYTSIAQGSDVATVHNADMVDGIHANGLFTNLSNSGNSLSITVGGTNKKLTVNYASNAGNADTLDGVHASGLFTNLSNSGNNISITIGGTNKTLTVGYATKAAQLNTARTLWGQSFDGTGNVNGTLTNTNSAGSETIIRCSNTNGQIDLLTSVYRGVYDRTKTRWLIGTNGANSWLDCGNVGIGTTAPAYKLDVSGDARATNFRGALVGNAATATKLQTARTIWGQSFNGTANVSGSITGVNNITMSNNSYLYGKNTGGTAIQLIAMASWNSVDIGRGALTYGYTTQVMGKTVALTASDDSGKNTKSVELSTAKLYSNVNIETEGGLLAHGGVTAYSSSDIRLKQDLRKLDYFGIIKAMGGTFGFAWKKDNTRSIGWIAQHVLCNPHLKDIVETDEKGYYKINYWSPKLIATAFGAIEQVGDEVSSLKARVVFLESEVQRLSGKQGSSNKKRLDNKNINLLN